MMNMQLLPSFNNPVHDGQLVFRALLKSMSEPGIPGSTENVIQKGSDVSTSIYGNTWSIAQALFDHDTAIYLSSGISSEALVRSIQFQTDAKITQTPEEANFAIITLEEMIDLDRFNLGSLEAPHESCTLIVQVEGFNDDNCFEIRGPGIKHSRTLSINGLSDLQRDAIVANQKLYPCGLDFIFCSPRDFIALPRTTYIVPSPRAQGEPSCM